MTDLERDEESGKVCVILSTCPLGSAEEIAQFLVENRHAACVNIVPQVTSIYRWEGRLEKESESLLVVKCSRSGAKEAIRALVEKHPYDVPEVVAMRVVDGNPEYLDWVCDCVAAPRQGS